MTIFWNIGCNHIILLVSFQPAFSVDIKNLYIKNMWKTILGIKLLILKFHLSRLFVFLRLKSKVFGHNFLLVLTTIFTNYLFKTNKLISHLQFFKLNLDHSLEYKNCKTLNRRTIFAFQDTCYRCAI